MKRIIFTATIAAIAALLCLPSFTLDAKKEKKGKTEYIYPGPEGWNEVEPERYGYDSEKFEEARKLLIEKSRVTGGVVIGGGEMIFRYGDIEEHS
jgi:hypothetical protein